MDMPIRDILHAQFDKVYIVHCTTGNTAAKRQLNIDRQLDYLGLSNDPLVHVWYGPRSKMNEILLCRNNMMLEY
jgi:hypothetical protein